MARARSPEKREAILQAAAHEIAKAGLGASTAKIAAAAGLAEGTLFTYFPSKGDLFNELYLALKTEAYKRIHAGFPHKAVLRERAQHIWTEYLRWAMERPDEQKVSVLLNLSPFITDATKQCLAAERETIQQAMDELEKVGVFASLPRGFASSAMMAMQEAVMDTTTKLPRQRAKLVDQAFEAFWRMAE
ncbi:MAG: TetR/AcrR family transcriptional regulator [Acidobacteriaceae bacterium]|nr:TetR/AcrR family transcriptional regulator [Acidobacteriaceae bacterium]